VKALVEKLEGQLHGLGIRLEAFRYWRALINAGQRGAWLTWDEEEEAHLVHDREGERMEGDRIDGESVVYGRAGKEIIVSPDTQG
jgi:hypothetical protein